MARWASSRARARSPTRSATTSRSAGSETRRSSGAAATRAGAGRSPASLGASGRVPRSGGAPVGGPSVPDLLGRLEAEDETELIVLVGEIGGDEEEKAAAFIETEVTKPMIAYIAGLTAPPGKTMGHAGAIISGSSGTAQAKKEALEARGVRIGTTPTEVAELAVEAAPPRPGGIP